MLSISVFKQSKRTLKWLLVIAFAACCHVGFTTGFIRGEEPATTDKELESQLGEMNEKASREYPNWAKEGEKSIPQDDIGLNDRINQMMNSALSARNAYDFESLENIRYQRNSLIENYSNANPESKSPWVAGFKALELCDGLSPALKAITPDSVTKVGLVEEAKYDDAFKTLQNAWKSFAEETNETEHVFGDVAVRAVEVVHQAGGIISLQEVMDPESEFFIADKNTLLRMLIVAVKKDPTCIMAQVYGQWLTPPDPDEAYLRAELRPRFSNRQKSSLNASHEMSLVPTRVRLSEKVREKPILPHHGPVECLKARALNWLSQDLEDTYLLAPDFMTNDYQLPGVIVDCQDAANAKMQLIYGDTLLCKSTDAEGKLRTAFIFYDEDKGTWSQRYLSLLYLEPKNLSDLNAKQRSLHTMLSALPVEKTIKLNQDTIKQYAYPSDATAELLRTKTKILRVDDINKLLDTKFTFSANNPEEVFNRLTHYLRHPELSSSQEEGAKDKIKISPLVGTMVIAQKLQNDRTVHPLVNLLGIDQASFKATIENSVYLTPGQLLSEDSRHYDPDKYQYLLSNRAAGDEWMKKMESLKSFDQDKTLKKDAGDEIFSFNPLLVVSDSDEAIAEPLWFQEIGKDGVPIKSLYSKEFGKIYFKQNLEDFGASWFEFKIRNSTVTYPLTYSAVPAPVLLATKSGRKLMDALLGSGFHPEDALVELAKILKTQQLPVRLQAYIQAKQSAAATTSVMSDYQLDAQLTSMYGFRYMQDPRGNFIINNGLRGDGDSEQDPEQTSPDQSEQEKKKKDRRKGGDLFTYIDNKGNEVPAQQHYTSEDYSNIHRNSYVEHLTKAVAYFPCTVTWQQFHDERLKLLFNPSGRVPAYLSGVYSKTNGEDDMFRKDSMQYGERLWPWNDAGSDKEIWKKLESGENSSEISSNVVRFETAAPASHLAKQLVKNLLGKEAGSAELKGLNRLAGFYGALWVVPFVGPTPEGSATGLREDLEFFNATAPEDFTRCDMLTNLIRYGARESARWQDLHASVVLYNDLLTLDFERTERFYENMIRGGGQGSRVNNFGFGDYYSTPSGRAARKAFGKDGNIFQQVPDTQAGVQLSRQIAASIDAESAKVCLLLELAGVLSQTRYVSTAERIWDEVVSSQELFIDPFIKESKSYFESYGLRLGKQVEEAIAYYTMLVELAEIRRRSRQLADGLPKTTASTPELSQRLTETLAKFLQFEIATIRQNVNRDLLKDFLSTEKELITLKQQSSFADWLNAAEQLVDRPSALLGRPYEFMPTSFLPLKYDSVDGFSTMSVSEIIPLIAKEVSAHEAQYEKGGFIPTTEIETMTAALMGWYFLEQKNFSASRRSYTLAAEGYFHLAEHEKDTKASLQHTLNAYQQLCGREAVVYRSPGCRDTSVSIYAGVLGPMLMWERRWFAAGLKGEHALNARENLIQTFDQIELAIDAILHSYEKDRIFFPDYRTFIGGAIPEPILAKALDSAWFREITTARQRLAELEAAAAKAAANKDAGDQPQEGQNGEQKVDKVQEAKEAADALYPSMLRSIIEIRAEGLDKDIANLGLAQ